MIKKISNARYPKISNAGKKLSAVGKSHVMTPWTAAAARSQVEGFKLLLRIWKNCFILDRDLFSCLRGIQRTIVSPAFFEKKDAGPVFTGEKIGLRAGMSAGILFVLEFEKKRKRQ
jgi:hypothetical protein